VKRVWWLIGLLSATAAASYLCRVNLSVTGTLLHERIRFSQVVMGGRSALSCWDMRLFQVPAGMLADRFGARRVLIFAALWWWREPCSWRA